MNTDEPDFLFIKTQLEDGLVLPFLGSAASLISSPSPPTAVDLAKKLIEETEFPANELLDLPKVAQYLKSVGGAGPLYNKLHAIFDVNFGVSKLHDYLATVARHKPLLIITTNYDDLIERAFAEVEHDTVIHICKPKLGPKVFWTKHRRDSNGNWNSSDPEMVVPNKLKIDLETTTVIYKMHGTVDRQKADRDQYVIAEDDYIDFLTRMTKNQAIPSIFSKVFPERHFLFLGYSLRDWNLRVVLNRIQTNSHDYSDYNSWAIQYQPSPLERRFWEKRYVLLYDMKLEAFTEELINAS